MAKPGLSLRYAVSIKTPPDPDDFDFESAVELVIVNSKHITFGHIDTFIKIIDNFGDDVSVRGILPKLYKWHEIYATVIEIAGIKMKASRDMLVKQTFDIISRDKDRYIPLR